MAKLRAVLCVSLGNVAGMVALLILLQLRTNVKLLD